MIELGVGRCVVQVVLVECVMGAGVILDAGVGVAALVRGGNDLEYYVLAHDAVHGQERSIFWVEVGVAATVGTSMIGFLGGDWTIRL